MERREIEYKINKQRDKVSVLRRLIEEVENKLACLNDELDEEDSILDELESILEDGRYNEYDENIILDGQLKFID